jgi:hypothetical protein
MSPRTLGVPADPDRPEPQAAAVNVSRQLAILRAAGLVEDRRQS